VQQGLSKNFFLENVPCVVRRCPLHDKSSAKFIHVTCLGHGLNREAENMRNQFPIVNDLISNVKKVFLKSSLRVQFYEEQLSNVALPPDPIIITRRKVHG
jgi:hypothetical protein